MSVWLQPLAVVSLAICALCAVIIAIDILAGHRQKMWIMNLVWPITALYSGPLGLWAYFSIGRSAAKANQENADHHHSTVHKKPKPFWQMVGVAATHCGAGCTLGDLCAEWIVYFAPVVLFGRAIFGSWVIDFLFAFAFGICFQYFTIVPMRHLSIGAGLWAAVKADTLSLTAWQVGMYGWMAVVTFVLFGELSKTDPVFWFMMQIAMLVGFLTAYPINWWLLRAGLKERM